MTEFWKWFLIIGGGLIFFISVLDSAIRGFKYFKTGRKTAGDHFSNRVKSVIAEDRHANCPWYLNSERDAKAREREVQLLKEAVIAELQPIKQDISEIKDLTKRLHHSQMTDLQIKLNHLYHDKFDKKGILTKAEQSNWDKWFSDYTSLGGNSDIKRMDEIIQSARREMTLEKTRKNKEEDSGSEN